LLAYCSADTFADDPPADLKTETSGLDLPLPLLSSQRTEQQQDRLHAITLFAQGRREYGQRNYESALHKYQRAWRYDTSVMSITNELIPLAVRLGKNQVAAQYAEMALEMDNLDAQSLDRIANTLEKNDKHAAAIKAYMKKFATVMEDTRDGSYLIHHVKIGQLAFKAGDLKGAAAAFDIVQHGLDNPANYQLNNVQRQQIEGRDGAIFLVMGECYLQTEQFNKAHAALTTANTKTPNEPRFAMGMAKLAFAKHEHTACIEQLKHFFDTRQIPDDTSAYDMLIQVNRLRHDDQAKADEASIMTLQMLLPDQIKNHPLSFTLAKLMTEYPRYHENGLEIYRQFLPKQPSPKLYPHAFDALLKKPTKQAVAKDAQALELVWILANFYARERNFQSLGEESIKRLGKQTKLLARMQAVTTAYAENGAIPNGTPLALKAFPGHSAAALALVHMSLGEWEQAKTFIQLAMKAAPNQTSQFYETWGIQSYLAGRTAEASTIFEQAIASPAVQPKTVFHYFQAGVALALEDQPTALKSAQLASEQGKSNPRLLSRYPWVLYRTGNYQKADQLYSELVLKFQNQTSNPAVNEVVQEAMIILSNICIHLEKDEAAVEWLEKVLDSNPQHIGALNDLGYLWAEQNQHLQRATVMLETAVHAQPENQAYRDSLGWVYYRLGDFKRAQIELEKAAAGKETDGVILDHLGDTYLQLQNKTKARQLWKDAIKAFDPQRDAQKIKATQHKLTTTPE